MKVDYDKEEQEFIKELEAGKYDIEIMPNEGVDYLGNEDDDFDAFTEHLESDASKSLCSEVLKK